MFNKIHEEAEIHTSAFIDEFSIIGKGVKIEKDVYISSGVKIYGRAFIQQGCFIGENCIIGHPIRYRLKKSIEAKESLYNTEGNLVNIGRDCLVRAGTIIYSGVSLGAHSQTGHHVLIREDTNIGQGALIGTKTVIDGKTIIGANANFQTGVYIPLNCKIGNNVFMGPHSCETNDKFMTRSETELIGPIIENNVSIGANSVILPGINIQEGTMVGAGTVVTKNTNKNDIIIGNPARLLKKKPNNWR